MRETAPKNSYIHVEEFSTVKELVKYIQYLDNNQTAYLEYHQVKEKNTKNKSVLKKYFSGDQKISHQTLLKISMGPSLII